MANVSLICHPDTPALAVHSIEISYKFQADGRIWLRYFVECDVDRLETLSPARAERTDGLWNSTCFELFVAAADGAYFEYNFAPSSQWAAYRFSGYRDGMADWPTDAPNIGDDASETSFALEVTLELPVVAVQIGLSAVVHESGDVKSYWALRHPPGKPDFHHKDCFALKLSPPQKV